MTDTQRDARGDAPGCDCCSPEHDGAAVDRDRSADGPGADSASVLRLSIPEMDCPSCAEKVTRSVASLGDGVRGIDARPTSGTLVVRYDSGETAPEAVRDRVEAAGYEVRDGKTETFDVPEMDCPSCAGTVERALSSLDGAIEVETRPVAGRVVVTYDPGRTSRGAVVAAIEGAGYAVESADGPASPHSIWRSRRALKTWSGAAFLLAGILFEYLLVAQNAPLATLAGRDVTVDWLLYVAAAAVAGQGIVRNGYYSARNRSLDIDFLMAAGVLGALAVNLPFEAATLAVLFSVAELLERFSMDRARNSLRELMELSPDTATVRRDGAEETVPVEDVSVGETVVVRPGEKIPLDGVVRDGASAVDESPITGESVPVDKSEGDEVYAGGINEGGYLEVEATAAAADSTLSRVIELVEDAQANRTESERFVDRFARYYTPVIVAGAALTFLLSPFVLGVTWTEAFVRGLTLLVIACPCAFVISTPVSVVSGVTSAARNGVLIKGGTHLEAMGEVDAVALDKTGTLTRGELTVTDVIALNGTTRADLLRCARAVERRSEHPIGAAIVDYATRELRGAEGPLDERDDGSNRSGGRGDPDREVDDFESIAGKGVRATLDGTTHYAGKPGLFADLGFDLEHAHVETDGGAAVVGEHLSRATDCEHGSYLDLVNETVPRLQAEGKTVVLVGTEDEPEGAIAIADTVRPEAEWAVSRLRDLGVERIVMLTGDNERTARVIGERVGVDAVNADLLPEEKVAAVERLREECGTVAMVGDGVNDAPALATASVGIAMGAAGTDTALETADVALMGDDLSKLPYLYALSRKANGVIRQNVWSSLGVKAVLAIGAPLGFVSVIHAVVIGDMGMSLGVTGNAMRLAGVSPDGDAPTAADERRPERSD
ncbi:heavy metal translocating P-type ATPase [Halegenticoccus tardaugens]|uniref:heavy metal translocating P-type ATPase n=1 Tax=Halegenticoccus tardaugens TaxID=2071624 RepID=UPI00100A44F9|nr:heavy metal translocating P-type ATPase [Halegenticoccus tardaugens]